MKKKIVLGMIGVLMMSGCSALKDETPPVLELNKVRTQVALNSQFDYMSYVKSATDDEEDLIDQVTYDKIDTSKAGQQTITYQVKDKAENVAEQKLVVDVLEMYEGGIFSPNSIQADIVENPEDITVLVNKLHAIPKGWTPDDLEPVIDNGAQKLRKEANEAYTRFYKDAKKKGIAIFSISGYRTRATQNLYWNNMVRVYGEEYASQYSAFPDRSEHQLGLAIDVSYKTTGNRLSEKVADTEIGQFIANHGHEYGFILRYPKDKVAITNYGYEPWHMRYVGVELATKLHNENLTLEEYYKQ